MKKSFAFAALIALSNASAFAADTAVKVDPNKLETPGREEQTLLAKPAPSVTAAVAAAMPPFSPAPKGAKVFFKNLKDGQKVKPDANGAIKIEFGLSGMDVAPAATLKASTGHHHIVVDGQPVAEKEAVPADATHIHFGKGQTEAEIKLAPGTHTLTLQFADGLHRSYGKALSQTVSITVL